MVYAIALIAIALSATILAPPALKIDTLEAIPKESSKSEHSKEKQPGMPLAPTTPEHKPPSTKKSPSTKHKKTSTKAKVSHAGPVKASKKAAKEHVSIGTLTINQHNQKALGYAHILGFNRHAALGNHEHCSRILKKITKINPNFSSATMLTHLFSTNQFEQVAAIAEKHRERFGKDNWEINFTAARALSSLKRNDEAEKMFLEASRCAKQTWDKEQATYALAVFYIQNQKHSDALKEIDVFLANTPPRAKHALFYFLKATIHLNTKQPQFETALAQLEKGLELNPHFERALKLKALVLEQQDKKPELILVLRKIIEIEPDAALTKRLVSLLFETGQLDQAYKTLAELHEKTADHFYDLGLIQWKLKRYDRALAHVDQAIKLNPEFARARLLRLEILLNADRKTEALNHLKHWITHGKDLKAFSILSMLTSNNTLAASDAIGLLQSLQGTSRAQKEVNSFLGDLYAMTGDYKAAERSYKYFLRSLSKDDRAMGLKAMYNLGFLHWKQGNIKQAVAEISKAHSIDQKNALITNFLAFLYTQQEDRKKVTRAKELLQNAKDMKIDEEDHIPELSSLLTAQANAYKLSPFWSSLDETKLHIKAPPLDSHITMTMKSQNLEI